MKKKVNFMRKVPFGSRDENSLISEVLAVMRYKELLTRLDVIHADGF